MLQIYNSLTRKKAPFVPLRPGEVRMYVCGMTVYDYCHLGHARVMVVFDTVVRYLRARGYRVTYVRNITDIDDKIIQRAAERHEDIASLTARFIEALHEDERALGVEPPTHEPRATGHIPQILAMIGRLLEHGCAYRAANGDVYYRVRRFANYGALSGKTLEELRAGARVEIGEEKEDPLDFVLWKAAKPGEPAWDSPWGPGRPGWHIECSAMSTAALGPHFDIHGGGMDLKFPHHENEIAQSECATGEPFVNVWMHVGFVRVNEEKMSKSLGNFFTVREVLKRYDPEVVRYFILTSHYRSPLDYTDGSLEQAKQALTRLYLALQGLPAGGDGAEAPPPGPAGDRGEAPRKEEGEAFRAAFEAAMDDDFNTPEALAVLFELARELNRLRAAGEQGRAARLGRRLRELAGVLGLLGHPPAAFLRGETAAAAGTAGPSPEEIETLIHQREQARRERNWAEADRIRTWLRERGVILEDVPGGKTLWRRA